MWLTCAPPGGRGGGPTSLWSSEKTSRYTAGGLRQEGLAQRGRWRVISSPRLPIFLSLSTPKEPIVGTGRGVTVTARRGPSTGDSVLLPPRRHQDPAPPRLTSAAKSGSRSCGELSPVLNETFPTHSIYPPWARVLLTPSASSHGQ